METFEIHITGNQAILDVDWIKTIAIDLLKPDGSLLRSEYMTSAVMKFENYQKCLEEVNKIVERLKLITNIVRVKIECPFYAHYEKQSLYIESHFDVKTPTQYPTSKNQKKTKLLGTERVYNDPANDQMQSLYLHFRLKWREAVNELCLYDSYVDEDSDWFSLWNN